MWLPSWLRRRLSKAALVVRRISNPSSALRFRPALEVLEDRSVPATLTVTTSLDVVDPGDKVLSLREALADAAPSGDTIKFARSLSGQTITLTSGPLDIDKSVTVQGPGADRLTISGNHTSRVFFVAIDVEATLAGLTIRDGNAIDSYGGGILNLGTLTVSNCTITNNTADYSGGGIYNSSGTLPTSGTLTVSGCSITGNTAGYSGGGIASVNGGSHNVWPARATIKSSIITDNVANGVSDGFEGTYNGGGGIYNDGLMTITKCTLTGNRATASPGGGILADHFLTIKNSQVTNNSAVHWGGGIFDNFTFVDIQNCIINNNTPDDVGTPGGSGL